MGVKSSNNVPGFDLLSRHSTVMGGDICIRNTRITVWSLILHKREGMTDKELIHHFGILTQEDLNEAWSYYAGNSKLVDKQARRHERAK